MILYIRGDVTRPVGTGPRVIVHVVNDVGAWGAGVSGAISRRWPEPEKRYRQWHQEKSWRYFGLGVVQFVQVEPELWVANLVGQEGLRRKGYPPPVRYEAIQTGLESVALFCQQRRAAVHAPKFGAGLAGGDWARIEALVMDTLVAEGIPVTIYEIE